MSSKCEASFTVARKPSFGLSFLKLAMVLWSGKPSHKLHKFYYYPFFLERSRNACDWDSRKYRVLINLRMISRPPVFYKLKSNPKSGNVRLSTKKINKSDLIVLIYRIIYGWGKSGVGIVGSRDEFTHKLSFSGIKAHLKPELTKLFERF
jgi:hypothetical protein